MKRPIKLIALDIDGTLLDDGGNISPNTNSKLKELIEKGVHIVLATGRTHQSADNLQKRLSLDVPIISYNGGKVTIPSRGEIFDSKIPAKDALKIIEYAEENNVYAKVYIDDVMYISEEDQVSINFAKNHGIDYSAIGKLSSNIQQDVSMIVFIEKNEGLNDIETLFGDMNVSITRSMPQAYEFMAKGITKGSSLKILSDYLGINREEILAVGNALNDLEMLKFAGLGIAMKNSDHVLLKSWDIVSEYTNNEDGVFQIIKDL